MRFPVIVFKRKGELDSCASLGLSVRLSWSHSGVGRADGEGKSLPTGPLFFLLAVIFVFLATNTTICPGIRLPPDQLTQAFLVV